MSGQIGPCLGLKCSENGRLLGSWLVPVQESGDGVVARRSIRYLPYASPRLLTARPRKRRAAWASMLGCLLDHAVGVELPLAPGFHDLGVPCELGCFLEARHTYRVDDNESFARGLPPRARNHARSAARVVDVQECTDLESFDFERAIVDTRSLTVERRRRFFLEASKIYTAKAYIAKNLSSVVGGLLVLITGNTAVFMHTWFDRDAGIRGIPTLLYTEAIRRCLAIPGVSTVDFEGSILHRVDAFMSGLGAEPVPYAHLYYHKDPDVLSAMLAESLTIPGRSK